jgi:hypothetical protein
MQRLDGKPVDGARDELVLETFALEHALDQL